MKALPVFKLEYICGNNGEQIATIQYPEEMEHEEALANARLMACAPEILSALEKIVQQNGLLSISREECAIMLELIAKAKGE
jgi:hypothetical protein